ncbi:MAG TPA: RNB domain-containing ribonuclease [Thermodesulfobacteriota bacterium]|nr:RNB domain-containing ribonuclease [Thermodesulfobacteriota bacterium]
MDRDHRRHRSNLKAIARRAMIERGLLPDFSAEVMTEIGRITSAAVEKDPKIRDLRGLLWASIDNDDSEDLDQLTVAEPLSGGAVKILVAIADVDAIVNKGTAIDGHARYNTTSVYTAAQIFSMLPEVLSTNLTSLRQDEERLAIIIEIVIGEDSSIAQWDLYRAVVRNRAKLTYNGVAAWLEGKKPVPERVAAVPALDEQIRIQDEVAQRLKNLRIDCGALQLETIEARPVFKGDLLTDLEVERTNQAKELIENFMIVANEATARYLEAKGLPSLRRVLRSPERWTRIVDLASGLGGHLPREPDSGALGAFLSKQRKADPIRFPDLSLSVVKLIGSGEYVVDLPGGTSPGHFGLAVKDYTHSTAPNRRFPDLITQRLLKTAMAERPVPYSNDELTGLAQHCTKKEDDANKVERLVRKSAAALLLESSIGQRFDAIVTGASEKGTWARLFHPPVEGKMIRGFEGLDVGDRVRVRLIATDVERGFIDFARAGSGQGEKH